jgi:peptidyl-prolyl cis-trans isomerase SurA
MVFLVPASGVSAQVCTNRVVAVVNGECITMFELDQRAKPYMERFKGRQLSEREQEAVLDLKRNLLQQMVDNILLEQEIEKVEVDVTEPEIENRIREMRNKLEANGQTLENYMSLKNLDMEGLKEDIRMEILKQRLIGFWVRRKVVVTDQEVERYYEEHKSGYVKEKRVALRLLVTPETVSLAQLVDRIQGGELSFAEAVEIYSVGPGTEDGGYIGFLSWKDLAPEWKRALEGHKAGEMSEPFDVQGREAILQVVDLEAGELEPLEAVYEDIKTKLLEEKYSERLDEYLTSLRKKAVIDIKI